MQIWSCAKNRTIILATLPKCFTLKDSKLLLNLLLFFLNFGTILILLFHINPLRSQICTYPVFLCSLYVSPNVFLDVGCGFAIVSDDLMLNMVPIRPPDHILNFWSLLRIGFPDFTAICLLHSLENGSWIAASLILVIVTAFAVSLMSLRALAAEYVWASANAHTMNDILCSASVTGSSKQETEDVFWGLRHLEEATGAWCPAPETCLIW